MAIGSLGKAGRLDQLRVFAALQLRSGYRSFDEVRADVLEAVSAEVSDLAEAARLTDEYLAEGDHAWRADAADWPEKTQHDALLAAFDQLRASDVVVLEAVDDHWVANDVLVALAEQGASPRGLAYFTHTDVWHAVEHQMLELNLWHGDRANVADSDQLLTDVVEVFTEHGFPAHFDEGRIEVTVSWQRRPPRPV
jgi:Domain of unknown function (DUF6891)